MKMDYSAILEWLKLIDASSGLTVYELNYGHPNLVQPVPNRWVSQGRGSDREVEFKGTLPTGWSREKDGADSNGWWLEENFKGKARRWRNIYSKKVVAEDPGSRPLSYYIIIEVCADLLCRCTEARHRGEIPHYPWAIIIHQFAVGCEEAGINGRELTRKFVQLIRKSPLPIPVLFDELSDQTLQADYFGNGLGVDAINITASREEIEETLRQHYRQSAEPGLEELLLLENLSDFGIIALADERQVEIKDDDSRYELIKRLTLGMLA